MVCLGAILFCEAGKITKLNRAYRPTTKEPRTTDINTATIVYLRTCACVDCSENTPQDYRRFTSRLGTASIHFCAGIKLSIFDMIKSRLKPCDTVLYRYFGLRLHRPLIRAHCSCPKGFPVTPAEL